MELRGKWFAMKILHTSDWHLGAMLHNEDRKEEHRQFLSWLLKTIKTECIDVLVVSGDIFDVYAPSAAAQKLYYDFLAGIIKMGDEPEVFIIAGNHDSQHFLGAPSDILSKLKIHVVSTVDTEKPENLIFEIKDNSARTALTVCAIPFLREKDLKLSGGALKPEDDDSLSARYNRATAAFYHKVYGIAKTKNAPVLMTGHFYLDGSRQSDDYSERTREVGNMRGLPAGLLPEADYYALGHLHKNQAINEKNHIRYSGSPLSMSFSEAGDTKYVIIAVFGADSAETKPVIQLKEIPVWQELRQISGSPDAILDEFRGIKASGRKVWIEIQVTDYDGNLYEFWNTLEKEALVASPLELPLAVVELPLEPPYKILVRQDMRVRGSADDWRDSDESGDLSSLDPTAVFQKFMQEQKITAEHAEVFMKMFNELYNDVIVNENGAADI
ncbi:MAG: exonuclease subunit SbcD [Spirochaetaceae bacterium]|jgi:exonuclease SbcD|nr:exonuclease subunit SbcD [Spirochaetaceae bacterium]